VCVVTDHRNRVTCAAPSGNIMNLFSVTWGTRCNTVNPELNLSTRNVQTELQETGNDISWERMGSCSSGL
jgi:hypothetical protein